MSLLDHQPERMEQSSELPAMEDQRSEPVEGEESQSVPPSGFQHTVMQMMEKMSQLEARRLIRQDGQVKHGLDTASIGESAVHP